MRKVFLGSNATSLIDSAPCPVLAVPEDTDFEGVDILTIEKMVELAKPFDADVHLAHILSKETDVGEDQMEWFKGLLLHKVG